MDAQQTKKHVLKLRQHNHNLKEEFLNPKKWKETECKNNEEKTITKSLYEPSLPRDKKE